MLKGDTILVSSLVDDNDVHVIFVLQKGLVLTHVFLKEEDVLMSSFRGNWEGQIRVDGFMGLLKDVVFYGRNKENKGLVSGRIVVVVNFIIPVD